jgi:hypothetical protein
MPSERYKACKRSARHSSSRRIFGYGKRSGQYWAANGPPPTLAMVFNVMDFLDLPANEVESILRDTARRKG